MLSNKSIIDIDDLDAEEISQILKNASSFLDISKREIKKVPALRGKTIVNLFFEPSTRTRVSFEIAAKRLSADMINFSASTSSLKKGESIIDTLKTILAMKVDLVIVRHSDSGAAAFVRDKINVPVINAGDGKHQHPTQALLDLYTIYEKFSTKDCLKVAIVGDIINSRVARSNLKIFKKMGMEVTLVSPSMLLPEDCRGYRVAESIDRVIEDIDILYMLRMQFERQERKFYPSIKEYNRFFSLTSDRFKKMKKDSIVMHPGPVNRGIEIDDSVMELERVFPKKIMIEEQVTGGVAVRMALLYLVLS